MSMPKRRNPTKRVARKLKAALKANRRYVKALNKCLRVIEVFKVHVENYEIALKARDARIEVLKK